MRNAFTVDVEEWFHVCGVAGPLSPERWERLESRVIPTTHRVLELLARRGTSATFFVLGWVAERHPGLVRSIVSAGHEVASHGHSHRRVWEMTPEEFSADLERSLAALGAAGAPAVRGYRAPEWSINDRSLWALELLARRGLAYDSSMTPLRLIGNPRYPQAPHRRSTPGGTLLEFPPLVARRWLNNIPLGGGWGLRMHSPGRVLREIRRCNRQGRPVALFLHPWEIDPDPPRVALPLGLRFGHYWRLEGFEGRLERILGEADFAPMGAIAAELGAAA